MLLFITIDAEAVHGDDPLNEFMWGRIRGFSGEYGIGKICDLCEENNFRAVFFLDVYEYTFFGDRELRNVAQYLQNRGHRVELHTHPAWFPDKRDSAKITEMRVGQSCYDFKRPYLRNYSLSEQIDIIKHGKNLLDQWIGYEPVAHRAGAYGVNEDTLRALKACNISVDSSMYRHSENCKISWSDNSMSIKDGIIEIPITFGKRIADYTLFNFRLKSKTEYPKTDVNWMTYNEIKNFVDSAISENLSHINLFLHSYSFIDYSEGFSRLKPNLAALDTFSRILGYLKEVGLQSSDFSNQELLIGKINEIDFVPRVGTRKVDLLNRLRLV